MTKTMIKQKNDKMTNLKKEAQDVALKMINDGLSKDLILKYTGLTIDQIQDLKTLRLPHHLSRH